MVHLAEEWRNLCRGGSGHGSRVRMVAITSCLLLFVFCGMKVVSTIHRTSGFHDRGDMKEETVIMQVDVPTVLAVLPNSQKGVEFLRWMGRVVGENCQS